jgi:hypothetical protein
MGSEYSSLDECLLIRDDEMTLLGQCRRTATHKGTATLYNLYMQHLRYSLPPDPNGNKTGFSIMGREFARQSGAGVISQVSQKYIGISPGLAPRWGM